MLKFSPQPSKNKKSQEEKDSQLYLLIYLLTMFTPSFLMFQGSSFYHFLSVQRIYFSHSFRVGLIKVFFYPRMSWFPLYSWKICLLGIRFWVNSYFISAPRKYCATIFCPPWFLMRNPLSFFSPLSKVSFFSGCFQDFYSLSLFPKSLIILCVGRDLLSLYCLELCSASWISRFVFLIKFGKFSAIISLKVFFNPDFFFLSETP